MYTLPWICIRFIKSRTSYNRIKRILGENDMEDIYSHDINQLIHDRNLLS
jgi:hypothetical protein